MNYNNIYGQLYICCFDWFGAVSNLANSALSVYNNERSLSASKEQLEREQKFNAEQAQLTRDYQTSERLATQEYNLEMWNLQNEYNSPEQQIQRLQAAGINPNTLFGSSQLANTSSSVASSTPMSGSVASTPSIASAMVANGLQLSNLLAQTRNLNADTRLKGQEFSYNDMTQEQRFELLKQEYDKNKVSIDNMLKDLDIKDVNKQTMLNTMHWYSKLSEAQLSTMSEQLNLLRNQSLHELAKIDNTKADTALKESQTQLTGAQTNVVNAQAGLIGEQTEGVKLDNKIKQVEVNFSNITGLPLGTSEFEMMFALWKKGDMDGFLSAMTTKAVSVAGGAIAQYGLGKIGKLGKGIGKFASNLWQKAKTMFNPINGRGKVVGNTITWGK